MECARASVSGAESLLRNLVDWHVSHANHANRGKAEFGQVDLASDPARLLLRLLSVWENVTVPPVSPRT